MAEIELDPDASAPATARTFVLDVAERLHLDGGLLPDVLLATSELVTNVVRHVNDRCVLRLIIAPSKIRVEVQDPDPEPLDLREVSTDDLGGRGLHLIEAISDDWGVAYSREGKVVFAEFQC